MRPPERGRERRLCLALGLLLGGAAPRAFGGAGTTAAEFLKVENGARPAAMGGAYAAAARDLSGGLYWNPAGLGFLRGSVVEASYNSSYQDISQGYLAYGRRFEGVGGLAAGLSYLSAGSQALTESNPQGGYTLLGSFTPSAWVVSAGWGRDFLDERGAAGVVVKEIDETMWTGGQQEGNPNDGGSTVAMDLGLMARFLDRRLSVGAAYQNLGPRLRGYSLPGLLRAGLGYETGGFTGTLDILAPREDVLECRTGLEYVIQKTLAVRAGYNSALSRGADRGPRALNAGFSTGIGLRIDGFGFDYAFVPYGDLGYAHRVGVSYRWGGKAAGGGAPSAPASAAAAAQPQGAACPEEGAAAAKMSADEAEVEQRFQKIDRLIESGEQLDALRALDYSALGLAADDSRQVRYLERWGTVLYQAKSFSAAEFAYRDAVRTAARLGVAAAWVADAYAGWARCRLEEKDIQKAEEAFRQALTHCPSRRTRQAVEAELKRLSGRGD